MHLRSFEVSIPGRHVLRIHGLGPGEAADGEHRIVFTRPHLTRSMGYLIGIVLSSVLSIGSIVFFFIRFASKGDGT